jgi:hypothetical protein
MLLHHVELFLRRTRTPPARFGRDAVSDPRFVFQLREGRKPRPRTVERVLTFIEQNQEQRL